MTLFLFRREIMKFQTSKILFSRMIVLLLGVFMLAEGNAQTLINFDRLWNYNNPAETEAKFIELIPMAKSSGNEDYYLQLKTQIARAQGLQGKFVEAHATLNEVETLISTDTPVAETRYYLERGRVYNSSNNKVLALPIFLKAFDVALSRNQDNLAVDAAHMVAIADNDPETQTKWNLKAISIAENSKDPRVRGWLGSLYNNMAWTFHDLGKFQEALDLFQKALIFFQENENDASVIRIAKWSVARAYRSLLNYPEALKIQTALEVELNNANEVDGYVYEELAEIYLLVPDREKAKHYFNLAYRELSQDEGLKTSDPKRIERLKNFGESL